MAVTSTPYGLATVGFGEGEFTLPADDELRVLLVAAAYTPNVETHRYLSDVGAELPTAGGYTAGGKTLTGVAWAYESWDSGPVQHGAVLRADPPMWSPLTATFRYAVLCKWTGTAATSPLLTLVDLGADQSPAGIDYLLQWDPAGIFRIRRELAVSSMAVTSTPYGLATVGFGEGEFALPADELRVLLVAAAYTPNVETHRYLSDVGAELPTGGGYTAGGKTLTGVAWAYESWDSGPVQHGAVLRADPPTWSPLTATFRYAVLCKWTGTGATSPLLTLVDLGADQSPAGIDYLLQWDPAGIYRIRREPAA